MSKQRDKHWGVVINEEADKALIKGSPVKIKGDGGVWIIQATNALNQTAEVVSQTKQYHVEEALENLSFWLGGEHGELK